LKRVAAWSLVIVLPAPSGCGAERWAFDTEGVDAGAESGLADDGAADADVDALSPPPDGPAEAGWGVEAGPSREASAGCFADRDCPFTSPACDLSSGQCLPCLGDSDCAGAPGGPACDVPSGTCVPCTSDTDCQGQRGQPRCDTSTHTCVVCLSQTDCPRESFCQPSHTCAPSI
jgi:hypothetical protein